MILNIKCHIHPIYDQNYIKAKVKTFNKVDNTVFSDNRIPNLRNHYTCIAINMY